MFVFTVQYFLEVIEKSQKVVLHCIHNTYLHLLHSLLANCSKLIILALFYGSFSCFDSIGLMCPEHHIPEHGILSEIARLSISMMHFMSTNVVPNEKPTKINVVNCVIHHGHQGVDGKENDQSHLMNSTILVNNLGAKIHTRKPNHLFHWMFIGGIPVTSSRHGLSMMVFVTKGVNHRVVH